MKIDYDKKNDSLYIRLAARRVVESSEAAPGFVLDYDAEGRVVGIDIERASKRTDLKRFTINGPYRVQATAKTRGPGVSLRTT
jgi:uncharacterized protein YuzE